MLAKIKLKPSKGFLGAAKTTKKAPYQELDRTPAMYPYGKDSYFVTPSGEEGRNRYADGIKR